jgi:hypothetical protein
VREATEAAGAMLLYLPPHFARPQSQSNSSSPSYKALLRKAAERLVEALWNLIADLLDAFTLDECANYFRNAGCAS